MIECKIEFMSGKREGGGNPAPSSYKKAVEYSYRAEMHVYSPIFQGQLIEGLKKIVKKCYNIFLKTNNKM